LFNAIFEALIAAEDPDLQLYYTFSMGKQLDPEDEGTMIL
jgi:hypothetical protein